MTKKNVRLSVIIITKNEALGLRDCLEAVKWADEIVIVDSGSTDDTLKIAGEYTDKVYSTDWPGFGKQKNRAIDYANGEWILSVDADEIISSELKTSIETVIHADDDITYFCLRRSRFLGKIIRYGDWQNDYCLRLFKKGSAHFSDDLVHERLLTERKTKKLKGILWHNTMDTLDDALQKMLRYSTLSAQMKFQQSKRSGVLKAFGKAFWCFFRGYVLRRGFLDGKHGLILAIMNAEGTFYKYLKLWELSK